MHVAARRAEAGAKIVTSALVGLLRDDQPAREEFLTLTGGRA